MPRRELRLQKKIVAEIKRRGGEARIVSQTGVTTIGDSDIYGCIGGLFIYIEVKDGDEFKVSNIQNYRLRQWARAGAFIFAVRSFEEAIAAIDAVSAVGRPKPRYARVQDNKRHAGSPPARKASARSPRK